jgi:hypothetical protein
VKIAIIPEDQHADQYIVGPIVERIARDVGISGVVRVLFEPRLRGASEALNPGVLAEIVNENRMVDAFVLVVDRDCDREHHEARLADRVREHGGKVIGCLARQEVEVWMLALHAKELSASWTEVLEECDPKERFAEPLLKRLGRDGPGRGRKAAMSALDGDGMKTLLTKCSELSALRDALAALKTKTP